MDYSVNAHTRQEATVLPHRGQFQGEGFDLFGIRLVNGILTFMTLGIYAAWGKAKLYDYFFSHSIFAGSRFRFTGNGREIFIGYLKALAVIAVLYISFVAAIMFGVSQKVEWIGIVGLLVLYVAFGYLAQFAYFASRRYRFSRTTYREIRFRLEGSPIAFANESFGNLLIGILTLGFLLPRYFHRKFTLIHSNMHFGNIPFRYEGDETEFRNIALPGFLLTVMTLGIYYFWWYPKMYNYYYGHLRVGDSLFKAQMTAEDFAALALPNLILMIATFGLAYAWVQVRTTRFYFEQISLDGSFDIESAVQVATQKADAGGEGLSSVLDMDADFGF